MPAFGDGLFSPGSEVSLTICWMPLSWIARMASALPSPEMLGVTALIVA